MNGCVAIVLARAGSKGLSHKNERTVAGRVMVEWTLDHALHSNCIDTIAFTTDSELLRRLVLGYSRHDNTICVIKRPHDLAGDLATVACAAQHALLQVEAIHAQTFEHVAILYGNVPVRPHDLTDRAVAALRRTGCDSVQSVCDVGKHHPYWMKTLDSDGVSQRDMASDSCQTLRPYLENRIDRRQDLPKLYELNGGIIAVRRDLLAELATASHDPHAFLGDDRRAIITGRHDVIDVDEAMDIWVAEAALRERRTHAKAA